MKINYDQDGELSLLGCCVLNANFARLACQSLKPEHFTRLQHVEVFKIILDLYTEGSEINLSTVVSKSRIKGNFEDLRETLSGLKPMAASSSFHANLENIRQNYAKTLIAELLAQLSENFENSTVSEIYKVISDYNNSNIEVKTYTPKDLHEGEFYDDQCFESWLTNRVDAYRDGQTISGLPTGFFHLDNLINGMNPSHYIIVAGLPGSGKTSFALQIMKYLIENNVKVGFFSLEMIREQAWNKLLSYQTQIPFNKIIRGQINDEEKYHLLNASKELSKNQNFFLQDAAINDLISLRCRMKYLVEVKGVKAVVIDYVTLIRNQIKYGGPVEQIASISMEIRELLKEFRIPGIIISQLNRESASAGKAAEGHHLYGSGQLEKDAHEILILHKEEFLDNSRQLYIRKNRFGYLDKITYEFEKGIFKEVGVR